jgi:alpha-tubulin suppressor-like RCC1 family protein
MRFLLLCLALLGLCYCRSNVVTFGATPLASGRNTTANLTGVDFVTDVFDEAVVSTAVGNETTYFLTSSGKVYGTGSSSSGALSLGTALSSNFINPIAIQDNDFVINSAPVRMISAGSDSALLLTKYGKAYAFGAMSRFAT